MKIVISILVQKWRRSVFQSLWHVGKFVGKEVIITTENAMVKIINICQYLSDYFVKFDIYVKMSMAKNQKKNENQSNNTFSNSTDK